MTSLGQKLLNSFGRIKDSTVNFVRQNPTPAGYFQNKFNPPMVSPIPQQQPQQPVFQKSFGPVNIKLQNSPMVQFGSRAIKAFDPQFQLGKLTGGALGNRIDQNRLVNTQNTQFDQSKKNRDLVNKLMLEKKYSQAKQVLDMDTAQAANVAGQYGQVAKQGSEIIGKVPKATVRAGISTLGFLSPGKKLALGLGAGLGGGLSAAMGGNFWEGAGEGVAMTPETLGLGRFTNPATAKILQSSPQAKNFLVNQLTSRSITGIANVAEGRLLDRVDSRDRTRFNDALEFMLGAVMNSPSNDIALKRASDIYNRKVPPNVKKFLGTTLGSIDRFYKLWSLPVSVFDKTTGKKVHIPYWQYAMKGKPDSIGGSDKVHSELQINRIDETQMTNDMLGIRNKPEMVDSGKFKGKYQRGDLTRLEGYLDEILGTESKMISGKYTEKLPARQTAFNELEFYAKQQGPDSEPAALLQQARELENEIIKAQNVKNGVKVTEPTVQKTVEPPDHRLSQSDPSATLKNQQPKQPVSPLKQKGVYQASNVQTGPRLNQIDLTNGSTNPQPYVNPKVQKAKQIPSTSEPVLQPGAKNPVYPGEQQTAIPSQKPSPAKPGEVSGVQPQSSNSSPNGRVNQNTEGSYNTKNQLYVEQMNRNVSQSVEPTTTIGKQTKSIPQQGKAPYDQIASQAPQKGTKTGSVQGDLKNPLDESIPQTDNDLISILTKAIKEAKPLRGAQEALYRKARSQKYARMMGSRGKVSGEKGYFADLGALKGEMPKVEFESIRKNFTQQNVDRLFDMIRNNDVLDDWDKVGAETGLSKILGMEGGGVPTRGELEKLYSIFGKDFTEAILDKRSNLAKFGEAAMQIYNLPRSIMAGVGDLSATLMQNLVFAYRHPIMTAKNFKREVKMFANDEYYRISMKEITQRPNYKLMKKSGLSLTDTGPLINKREEAFMSSWAEKIPGVGKVIKASGRAYTGFINRMRADVFDQLVDSYKSTGGDVEDTYFLKSLGEFVNAGTGRGDLGAFEKSAGAMGQIFFSARKLAGAVKLINPMFYLNAHPQVRKEALKTMLAFIAGGTAITGLAELAGAEVSKDPTNADFGKIKIGNTRFNVWGSYQQMAVLMARLWKGYGTSSVTGKRFTLNDGYKPVTRLDLITRFFENKEHPTLSLMLGALRGQNNVGEDFNLPTETLQRFIPMVLGDGFDLYQEHGPIGLLGVIPTILGIPAQTYGRRYPTIETTEAGNPTVRLKGTPDLASTIVHGVTGKPFTNIPESEHATFIKAKEDEEAVGRLKEEMKTNRVNENGAKQANYTLDGVDYEGYEVSGKFVYTDENGEIKTKTMDSVVKQQRNDEKGIIDANYSLVSDRLKRTKSYGDWITITQGYVKYLQKYKGELDPKKDAKEIISTQNKIEDLIYQAQKRSGFGGSGGGKKLISDAELLSSYKKMLEASLTSPRQSQSGRRSQIIQPLRLKRQTIRSLR